MTVSLIILIVVVAFFAQSIFGFGGGLMAIFLGQRIHYKIKEEHYRYCVYAILFFSAVSLFLKA